MKSAVRIRFWLEAGLAVLSGSLAVVTLFWRDWIEAFTGVDPDHHSGALEWAIVAGMAVTSMIGALVARAEWRATQSTWK